jgi:hypothetical protein
MHYFVYLDEFGHIGKFVSRNHKKFNSSPVFGLGGIILPVNEVRNFSIFFYKLKARLLSAEIAQLGAHPSKWEKKGSELYTVGNVNKHPGIRKATKRIIRQIEKVNGYIFYTGIGKDVPSLEHKPTALYLSVLKDAIRKLDVIFKNLDSTFSLFLDSVDSPTPGDKSNFRLSGIEVASVEMFGADPKHSLLEPPYQLESHIYQNLQCADWFCGLFNRIYSYKVKPQEYADFEYFEKNFAGRLDQITKAGSVRWTPWALPAEADPVDATGPNEA